MINYFTISYKARPHRQDCVDNSFLGAATSAIAHEIASSAEEAVAKLKASFSMLDIEVISVSSMKSMSEEDFLKAGKFT